MSSSRYALKALQGLSKGAKVISSYNDFPPAISYAFNNIVPKTSYDSQVNFVNELRRVSQEQQLHVKHAGDIYLGPEIERQRTQGRIRDEEVLAEQNPQVKIYATWRNQVLTDLVTKISKINEALEKPIDQIDYTQFTQSLASAPVPSAKKSAEAKADDAPTTKELADLMARITSPVDKTIPDEGIQTVAERKVIRAKEKEQAERQQKDAKVLEQSFEILDDHGRKEMKRFLTTIFNTHRQQSSISKELSELLVESASALRPGEDVIERDIVASLEKFDNQQGFLLNSYANKKPTSCIELADVLLQASQMKTTFKPLYTFNDVLEGFEKLRNSTAAEATDIYRILSWQLRQSARENLGIPMQALPADLYYDPVRHSPFSQRLSSFYQNIITEGKGVTADNAQAISDLLMDYKNRVSIIQDSALLFSKLLPTHLNNKEKFAIPFEQERTQVVQLKEKLIEYEFNKYKDSLTSTYEKEMLTNSEKIRRLTEELHAKQEKDLVRDSNLSSQIYKLQQENFRLLIAEVKKTVPELSEVADIITSVDNARFGELVPQILAAEQGEHAQRYLEAGRTVKQALETPDLDDIKFTSMIQSFTDSLASSSNYTKELHTQYLAIKNAIIDAVLYKLVSKDCLSKQSASLDVAFANFLVEKENVTGISRADQFAWKVEKFTKFAPEGTDKRLIVAQELFVLASLASRVNAELLDPELSLVANKDETSFIEIAGDIQELIQLLHFGPKIFTPQTSIEQMNTAMDKLLEQRRTISLAFQKKVETELLTKEKYNIVMSKVAEAESRGVVPVVRRLINKFREHANKLFNGSYTIADSSKAEAQWREAKEKNKVAVKDMEDLQMAQKLLLEVVESHVLPKVKSERISEDDAANIVRLFHEKYMVAREAKQAEIKKQKELELINSKNFVPEFEMIWTSTIGPLHDGYVGPREHVVKMRCPIENMKLGEEGLKRLKAICGDRIKKNVLVIESKLFSTVQKNKRYARQMLIELVKEARKADKSEEFRVKPVEQVPETPLDRLAKSVAPYAEEEAMAEKALELWKKYREAGKVIIGLDLTLPEAQQKVQEVVQKKKSKAAQLGYDVEVDDAEFGEEEEAEEDTAKKMKSEFEEFE